MYVIGSNGFKNLNPLSIVSTGNVPPAAANWSTNIINAKNFPISPKFLIKNCIIVINTPPVMAHSNKYTPIFVTSKPNPNFNTNPVTTPSINPIPIYIKFCKILFFAL